MIKTWQTADGLPENSATAIVQTSDGYLWFGTFDGLVRFDGVRFKVLDHRNTPALPSSKIVNLHLDGLGRIWVSTVAGLVLWDGRDWRRLSEEDPAQGDFIRTFSERSNGDLLLTAFNGKVMEYRDGHLAQLPPPPRTLRGGYLGYVDEAGQWWVVQNTFIGRWDGQQWVSTVSATDLAALRAEQVGCGMAKDGGLWLLLGSELRKYRHGSEVSRVQLPESLNGFWSLSEDSRGNVWICTYEKGVYQIKPSGELQRWDETNGLAYHGGRCAFEDREHNLWIGTSGGGLTRLKQRRCRSIGEASGLTERLVRTVWPAPGGGLWIGTYGKGLFRLSEDGVREAGITNLPPVTKYMQSVLTDQQERTWVGTYAQGLWILEKEGVRQVPIEQTGGSNILALFEDSRDKVWISGGAGAAVFEAGVFRGYGPNQGLPLKTVYGFAEDTGHAIWLWNEIGVFRLEGDHFVEVVDRENRSIKDVTYLKAGKNNAVWMGASDGGLLRWRGGVLTRIGASSGLPPKRINSILEDDAGLFWMTSDAGIVRAREMDLESVADGRLSRLECQVLDGSDGLETTEFPGGQQPMSARDASGRLWFATAKGVAMVDPARFRVNSVRPRTQIEEVFYYEGAKRAPGKPVEQKRITGPFAGRLEMPAGSRRVEIRYTAPGLTAPEKVRFQVKLDGVDEDWRDVENRRVAYFDEISPGSYGFRVRASNEDGLWEEGEASLVFTVLPLFWQTGWFRGLVWIAAIAEGFLILGLLKEMARGRRARAALDEQLRFEALISELSARFVNVPAGEVDREIMDAQRRICELLDLDLLMLWQPSGEAPDYFSVTHFYSAQQGSESRERLKEEDYPWFKQELVAGRIASFASLEELPAEAARDRESFRQLGAKSNLSLPLLVGGGPLIGAFCLNATRAERDWPDSLVRRLKLMAQIFANALSRKRADQALRESEGRMETGARLAGLGCYDIDYAGPSCFADERFGDICGVPPGTQPDLRRLQSWIEHIHPDDRQRVLDERQRVYDGKEEHYNIEYRYFHHTQGQKWIHHLSSVTSRDAAGHVSRIHGVVRDITERKRLLERLQSAAEEWQTTFDSINDLVMILDCEHRIIRVNASTLRFFRLPMEKVVGSNCFTLMHGTSCPIDGCPCQKTFKTNLGSELELFHAGSGKWLLLSTHPIRDDAGKVIGVVHVGRNITEAKRAEAELLQQRTELAHTARVSTMGEFAASVAHELNQPLGAILANAEAAELFLLQDPPALDELRSILAAIRKDDERAAEVIRRMRALLRKHGLERHPLDINSLVQDVRQMVSGDAALRGISLTLDLAPALPKVSGDRVHLQQVLLNLIINAMDAMANQPRDRCQISIRTRLATDGQVELAVIDSGHGIEPERLPRLFDPFFTTKANGMGMGLSIARTIIEAHRGRIWAENDTLGGAVFRIALPAGDAEQLAGTEPRSSAPPSRD